MSAKGIALALADGISSSEVSGEASETAVAAFLHDYYSTSEAWSVRKSAQSVLGAANSWLHAQTRNSRFRDDAERGYVCTFSALVLKGAGAHIFHVGDARVYRLREGVIEQLTEDHRHWVSRRESYLSRALGVHDEVKVDYRAEPLKQGDVFVMLTDGVHEFLSPAEMATALSASPLGLDEVARGLARRALEAGSSDNLSVQIVRLEEVPAQEPGDMHRHLEALPFPPELRAGMNFDGYRIERALHTSARSHAWLATDSDSGERVVIKTPGADLRQDAVLLEKFLLEEWVARRLHSPHLVKAARRRRGQHYLYVALEYIEGQSLRQWMLDNPDPPLEKVRGIIEQAARGLLALHRQEMVHQDLRPDNILIDAGGTVRIIDCGAVRVAGLSEGGLAAGDEEILGSRLYMAPECFLGEPGSPRSDIFSLGVIAYQLLTGRLPYGLAIARAGRRGGRRPDYRRATAFNRDCPSWVDGAIRRAVHPDPSKRYQEVAEFAWDLRHPRRDFLRAAPTPLVERDPLRFWKGLSLLLALSTAVLGLMLLT